MTLEQKRAEMDREAWIKNVMRIEKYTREEAETAYDRITSTVKMLRDFRENTKQHNCHG